MLASIAPAVDRLVVNDNSGLSRSDNLAKVERSPFAGGNRLHVIQTHFVDFGQMRNDALAPLHREPTPPDWVMFIDADEVHGDQLSYVARAVLPRLHATVGQLDAYVLSLLGTFSWYTDIGRRVFFYRYARELRWTNSVHEKLAGVRGSTVVIPYVYPHYGGVVGAERYAAKYARYRDLEDGVGAASQPPAWERLFAEKAPEVRPYRAPHPPAVQSTLQTIARER
ncbi:MAG: hypothetical protein ACREM8_02945, partial [Vulcanimicrobiaceae bacterium]